MTELTLTVSYPLPEPASLSQGCLDRTKYSHGDCYGFPGGRGKMPTSFGETSSSLSSHAEYGRGHSGTAGSRHGQFVRLGLPMNRDGHLTQADLTEVMQNPCFQQLESTQIVALTDPRLDLKLGARNWKEESRFIMTRASVSSPLLCVHLLSFSPHSISAASLAGLCPQSKHRFQGHCRW